MMSRDTSDVQVLGVQTFHANLSSEGLSLRAEVSDLLNQRQRRAPLLLELQDPEQSLDT